jgi:hypothetical protein
MKAADGASWDGRPPPFAFDARRLPWRVRCRATRDVTALKEAAAATDI